MAMLCVVIFFLNVLSIFFVIIFLWLDLGSFVGCVVLVFLRFFMFFVVWSWSTLGVEKEMKEEEWKVILYK